MKPATSLASYLLSFLTGIMCLSVCATGQDLVVDAVPSHVTNEFSPFRALGSTVDRIEVKAADKALEQPMLNEILGAGWQVISYRQNTELQAEAWHWNTDGTWSDPVGQGYFIGQATPSAASLDHSFGYALPHRGTTIDSVEQGFHYSKLPDGDPNTYWKSNPYLSQHVTGEDDSLLPQWVILDLGSVQKLNAIRIAWGEPYAKQYRVQFWTGGENHPRYQATSSIWQTFSQGIVNDSRGGTVTLPLTSKGPAMSESSR